MDGLRCQACQTGTVNGDDELCAACRPGIVLLAMGIHARELLDELREGRQCEIPQNVLTFLRKVARFGGPKPEAE